MQNTIAVFIRSDSSAGTATQVTLYFSQQGESGKPGADGKDGAAVSELMPLSFHLACSVGFVFALNRSETFHCSKCDLISPTICS